MNEGQNSNQIEPNPELDLEDNNLNQIENKKWGSQFLLNWKTQWKIQDKVTTKSSLYAILFFFLVEFIGLFFVSFCYLIFNVSIPAAPDTTPDIESDLTASEQSYYIYMLLVSISSYLFFILIGYFAFKNYFSSYLEFFKSKNKFLETMVWIIIFFIIYLLIVIFISIFTSLLYHWITGDHFSDLPINENQLIVENMIRSNWILGFLVVVILGPIVEELTFRAGIFGFFKSRTTGLIVSIIVFSLMHMIASLITKSYVDFWYLPSYLAISFILATAYVVTNKNLAATTGLHMSINCLSFIFLVVSITS